MLFDLLKTAEEINKCLNYRRQIRIDMDDRLIFFQLEYLHLWQISRVNVHIRIKVNVKARTQDYKN